LILNNEVPIKHQVDFSLYIKSLKKDNFNPDSIGFDLLEIGDTILKTIYVWNNSDKSESYADFSTKIETCILDKNTIITSLTKKVVEEDVIEDWINID